MRPPLPHRRVPRLQRVSRRLSDGRVRYHHYHRITRDPLPEPTDPSFDEAYAVAERKYHERQNGNAEQASGSPRVPGAERSPALSPQVKPPPPTQVDTSDVTAGNTLPIYLTPEELCERWRWRITPETLANHRAMKIGPPYCKFNKIILYRLDLIEQYEEQHLIRPAQSPGGDTKERFHGTKVL
jgi:hypothetical protein